MSAARGGAPARSESELIALQQRGDLQVCTAAQFHDRVAEQGLEQAFRQTHVVAAGEAGFTAQASLVLQLGPSDPPMRIERCRLGSAEASGGHGNTDLVLPMQGGGAAALEALLQGQRLPFSASGLASPQHPRQELETQLCLEQIGAGQVLLHRAIAENGVVAVSSREGLTPTPWGPVLGPLGSALFSCSGAGSIGFTMPGLHALGPGSPVLVAGAIGWVSGAGAGHQPKVRRQASGHALSPGASCALSVDLHGLEQRWIRACQHRQEGSGLLVAVAAPVPLLNLAIARQAACTNEHLQAPVLDYGVPRRVRPSLGSVSYTQLLSGQLMVGDQRLRCAPAHSPRLATEIALELSERLRSGRFPLRLPLVGLAERPALLPLE
ncbi:homocysteine biosynthesis protein [Synechococcus sp. HK05]|uniref:homocysteine biosynthesis protein n=1 Tax=Synechococcus sp. HK05 TaxID=2725975 RepID=UPI0034CEB67B